MANNIIKFEDLQKEREKKERRKNFIPAANFDNKYCTTMVIQLNNKIKYRVFEKKDIIKLTGLLISKFEIKPTEIFIAKMGSPKTVFKKISMDPVLLEIKYAITNKTLTRQMALDIVSYACSYYKIKVLQKM